jgi:aspartate racemase
MPRMKRIGILAHSAEGAALCFLAACHEGERLRGPHFHPAISLDIEAMGESMDDWEAMHLAPIRERFALSAARLAKAGADFFVCPDNTAHLALESEGPAFDIPGLHIACVVAQAAARRNLRRIGILGTKWTMHGPIYPREFRRAGIDSLAPPHATRMRVNTIIFDELVRGIVSESSRREMVAIVQHLKEEGCDAVLLGCTEIPMILNDEVSPLPVLDSTRLLAAAAVRVATGEAPMSGWRGGAV